MENKCSSLVLISNKATDDKKLKLDNDECQSCDNDDHHPNSGEVTKFKCSGQSGTGTTNLEADGGRSPIEIFPEELWELILHQLKNSQDILNVLLAFPELGKAFHNKKALWLFDLVLIQMTKYLIIKKYNQTDDHHKCVQSEELLNLRLVSKHWKTAVENLLVNHPDNHPPLPKKSSNDNSSDKSGPLTKTPFNYTRLDGFHFGATKFHTPNQIERFLEQMQNYSGNPFPGKSVFIKPLNEEATSSHDLVTSSKLS